MVTLKCTKESLAEALFRLTTDEVREMNMFDLMVLQNAHSKGHNFPQLPIKLQAVMIRLAGEVISEFEE
jgi:hypothetical protein